MTSKHDWVAIEGEHATRTARGSSRAVDETRFRASIRAVRPRPRPRGLTQPRRRPDSRRQTAMSLAVGSGLYQRPIDPLEESIHDRYLPFRRLFQPGWLRLRQRRRLGRLLGQAGG